MALILSAASGNFDASATWVGGVAPTVGDEARAATGHTITINVDTTCDEISNAGTGLYLLDDGVTLTANCTHKSTTINRTLLQFTAVSPAVGFIVGNVLAGTVSGAIGYNNTSTGTITITGNVTAGSAGTAIGCNNASTGTITITGNVTSGSAGTAFGCNNASTGTITITGNVTAGSGNGADGCRNASTGTIAVTGNSTGGSGTTAFGCNNASTGTLTVTGIATGGTTNGAAGANNASSGTLNVGRAKGNNFGIGSSGIVAGFGVASAQASITKIKELEYGLRGMSPTSGPAYLEPVLGNIAILVNFPSGSGNKTLSDPNNTAGLSPAITDVRTGVVYNNGNDTGTCAVPPAGSVALGVPVDATTGTATLTAANVRAAIGLATANLDTQLAALPTADENADGVWNALLADYTVDNTFGDRVVRSFNSNNELQLTGSHHAAADIHEFQPLVIESAAFATSTVTLFTAAMRTEITPELDEIGEIHAIHGLKSGSALTVTPSSRAAGAITQSITGDGTTTTTVTRT